jgi:hypothetical protein
LDHGWITVVWSSGIERGLGGRPLNISGTSTATYDISHTYAGQNPPAHGIFDGTTSQSNPKFNACAQVAPILISPFYQSGPLFNDIVARVYQTERDGIHVAVCREYGTQFFGSAFVGFGDYPTITSLRFESLDYRKMMAVVAWHDPVNSSIKFRSVWVDPTGGEVGPVV